MAKGETADCVVVTVKDEDEELPPPPPLPMMGLHDTALPPFLTKTFEMVEDPETDAVVSWSRGRNSFVVWEPHRFSITLLPKHFKHSNFSSFVRQLNTYGFRKVYPDRWEFAHEKFLGGQKHLLKDIKRRRNLGQSSQQQQGAGAVSELGQGACVELGQSGLEAEVDRLRRDRRILRAEMVRLKQQHQISRAQLLAMEERIQGTERKQQQTTAFLARALKNPLFIQQILLQIEQKKQFETVGRKRRLTATPSSENQGDALAIESEMENLIYAMSNDSCSSRTEKNVEEVFESNDQSLGVVSDVFWEEILHEGLLSGTDIGQGDQPEIDIEVGDLAANPYDWVGVKGLVDELSYLG